jgi:hypothetical protein
MQLTPPERAMDRRQQRLTAKRSTS